MKYIFFISIGLLFSSNVAGLHICGPNEKWDECGNACDPKCSDIASGRHAACILRCGPPACACKKGYARDEDNSCIPEDDCFEDEECPPDEELNNCGARCELTCREVVTGKPQACPKICDPPACVCKPNYARSIRQHLCIEKERCSWRDVD